MIAELDDFAVENHGVGGAQIGDVRERILLHDNHVGDFADLDGAQILILIDHLRRPLRGALNNLHGLNAGFGIDHHLVVHVDPGNLGGVGIAAGSEVASGVHEHFVEAQRVLKSLHPALVHFGRLGHVVVRA